VSRAAERRRRLAHVAAPVLFLAAVTAAVLLIRSGLESGTGSGGTTSTQGATTRAAATTVAHRARPRGGAKRFYTVQTGDTFNAIAAKTGVSVAELERLNPGVSSNSLHVGQRLRVK
jgi:LysM repeat protein